MYENILVCITGGIAAYKAASLVSKLTQNNYNVKVIMTNSACEFINPLTFQTLSKNKVITSMFSPPDNISAEHISLSKWADIITVYPATANCIGKLANGIADNMLSTVLLASDPKKIIIYPAMNSGMLNNSSVKRNLNILEKEYTIKNTNSGYLACGDIGSGRLIEPDTAFYEIIYHSYNKPLKNKKVLITAGATREKIDPVRFLSNYSSGKTGFALANAATLLGANVTLISGISNEMSLCKPIYVDSAIQMYEKTKEYFDNCDIFISSAAVMDYCPEKYSKNKIKKTDNNINLSLKRNPDILLELSKIKKEQILIGFAAETENIIENAKIKLKEKSLDMIVANKVNGVNCGFATENNSISIINKNGTIKEVNDKPKNELAYFILNELIGT